MIQQITSSSHCRVVNRCFFPNPPVILGDSRFMKLNCIGEELGAHIDSNWQEEEAFCPM